MLYNREGAAAMRHLFIINPVAKRINGNTKMVRSSIDSFFSQYPDIHYDIYVSKWCRDAVPYIRRYLANTRSNGDTETLRIHSIGGSGTLFEVVNSVIGVPNVEVAAHPYGKLNLFVRYYKNMTAFLSLSSQVFGASRPMDVIRSGNGYGICLGLVGLEAYVNRIGGMWVEKGMPSDPSYLIAGIKRMFDKNRSQKYKITIDGVPIRGDFLSVFIANVPNYGIRLRPGVHARPDDGKLEIYMMEDISPVKLLRYTLAYVYGRYEKIPEGCFRHYTAEKIEVTSNKVMYIDIDTECFYGTSAEFEIMPGAVRVVLPDDIKEGAE
jgi:diacylglycerol kinase family enzyme